MKVAVARTILGLVVALVVGFLGFTVVMLAVHAPIMLAVMGVTVVAGLGLGWALNTVEDARRERRLAARKKMMAAYSEQSAFRRDLYT